MLLVEAEVIGAEGPGVCIESEDINKDLHQRTVLKYPCELVNGLLSRVRTRVYILDPN